MQFSPHIATCYIINKDFDKAAEWIEFFEITNEIKDEIYFTKVLLDLYSSSDINSIIKILVLILKFSLMKILPQKIMN